MISGFRELRADRGRYLMAVLVGALALVAGGMTWPGLMLQALATLMVALRMGGGPGLVTGAIVWIGSAALYQDWASGDTRTSLNLLLLGAVCAISTWLGGAHHHARLVLRRQAEQQAALAEVGRLALLSEEPLTLVRNAVALTARVLGVEFCHFLERGKDGRTLLLRAGVGWEASLVGTARLDPPDGVGPAYSVPTWEPFILETVDSDRNSPPPPWLYEHGARVGMRTTVPGDGAASRGVLGVYTRRGGRTFTAHDVHFLEGMAFLISAVLARHDAARAVAEQLAVQKALLAGHDALGEGLVLVEAARPVLSNACFLELTGRSMEELREFPIDQLVSGLEVDRAGVRHNIGVLHTAKGTIPVEASTSVFHPHSVGECLAVLVRDLRPHLALERDLQEARDRAEREARHLADILAALPVGVAVAEPSGRVVTVNVAMRRIWGDAMPQASGLPEYEQFRAWFEPSGELVKPEEWALAIALLERRAVERRQLRIVNFDGCERYIANSAVALFGPDGKMAGAVSVTVDESDEVRARMELEALTNELEERVRVRTAQLEAANRELEAFSYTVAHDLRAPLRSMRGFTGAVLKDFGEALPAPALPFLERVIAAIGRMQGIIDDLLKLSEVTRSPLKRLPTDLSGTARDVLETLAAGEPGHRVDVVIESQIKIDADPDLLRILLENLLGNAWKYTKDRSPARIEVSRDSVDPRVVLIEDNGIGFDPVHSERIFLPFERLVNSSLFDGSGIGLSIVRRIVDRHGGWIRARGVPGQGACFRFTLSDAVESDEGTPEAADSRSP